MESLARRHSPPNRVRYPADCPFASVKQFTGLFHLSTPLRSDAVTFCFGVMACPGTDLHHAVYAPSRAHDSRRRGNDGAGRFMVVYRRVRVRAGLRNINNENSLRHGTVTPPSTSSVSRASA